MKKLRYGIVGLGGIAKYKHIPGYKPFDGTDVEFVAACDILPEKEAFAKESGFKKFFTDYKELLKEDLDYISVCTPNYLHAPITIEALNSGKHVHCEKPMAMSGEEADAMLAAAKANKKILMVALNNRFTPATQFVKQYVDEGNLGEIYFAKCGWVRRAGSANSGWFTDKKQSGGGPIIDLGVHFIDLVMYFMNYPDLASAHARTYAKLHNQPKGYLYSYNRQPKPEGFTYSVEDFSTGMLEFKNDASLVFEISWASNIEKEFTYYDLYGTQGGLRFYNDFQSDPRNGIRIFKIINDQHCDITPNISSAATPNTDSGISETTTEFGHFLNSVVTGNQPTISIPEQGPKMIKIIDAIYKSANEKRQILL